jgi:hypothetical protein
MIIGLGDSSISIGFKNDQILVWSLIFGFSQREQRWISIYFIKTLVNGFLRVSFINLFHLLDLNELFKAHNEGWVSWLYKIRNSQVQMVFEGFYRSRITIAPLCPFILICYQRFLLLEVETKNLFRFLFLL